MHPKKRHKPIIALKIKTGSAMKDMTTVSLAICHHCHHGNSYSYRAM